jgi:Zn ribbon nucleic-acid-binding protein
MKYKKYSLLKFFREINTEEKAQEMIWKSRFGEAGFECGKCKGKEYYNLATRVDVRKCKGCGFHQRLRAGAIFHRSHLSALTWVRAIFLVTQSKRGISALELQRQLELTRYETAWNLLQKIRHAMRERDQSYQIQGIIELDGASYGKKSSGTQKRVLIGVETKRWWTQDGKIKQKAGFAKVMVAPESALFTNDFIKKQIMPGSTLKTDGASAYSDPEIPSGVQVFSETMAKDKDKLRYWLPWVHKFIANSKRWVLGTHHGIRSSKYLDLYLAEYTYRFNRRHDHVCLFDRALKACAVATPVTLGALTG